MLAQQNGDADSDRLSESGSAETSKTVDAGIDFSRDVRPILSDTCFKCHGPDANTREAALRLDTEEGVFDDGEVIEPGDLENSELYQRIVSDDPDLLMPPPDSGRELTEEQIKIIRDWIQQGAKWSRHWSLEPIGNPEIPQSHADAWDAKNWARQPLDHFIAEKLGENQLRPSPPADRATLCRRVYLDLTGMPPTPDQLQQFLADDRDDAYERLVDQLLASPHYGEHMARFWLDAARYGDTHGLHLDNYREMWPYRDWVINAFNQNKSYRDFTIEQLAGDLLPDATEDQKIASGFNRAHVTTNEGGSIKEEVYVRNVIDRVATTGIVFMGLTTECASCHDHKFDPISQREFYELFAFFNSLDRNPMDGNVKDYAPVLRVMSDGQKEQLESLEQSVKTAQETYRAAIENYEYVDPLSEADIAKGENESVPNEPTEVVWIDDELPAGARAQGNWKYETRKSEDESGKIVFSGLKASLGKAGNGFAQHFFTDASLQLQVGPDDTLFAHVYLDPKDPPRQIMLQFNDGNWEHRAYWGANEINFGPDNTPARLRLGDLPETGAWIRLEVPAAKVGFTEPAMLNGWAFSQSNGTVYWDRSGVVSSLEQQLNFDSLNKWLHFFAERQGRGLPGPQANLLKKPVAELTPDQRNELREFFLTQVYGPSRVELKPLQEAITEAEKKRNSFQQGLPTTMISAELDEPKPAFVLERGQYDARGDAVQRKVPSALPAMPDDLPRDRLGFAQWLVAGYHPLTSRVAVNRFWQQVFGVGLVKTSEDFGSQGEWPSHPELLDFLARDFMQHDWDIKRLMRQLVTSATYRQSSRVTPELWEMDPENRLLARGPRYRLDAEALRDSALAVSGLLNNKIGGPPVKPPQPDGLWFAVGYSGSNTVRFKPDQGPEKVHRRSIYTFWKRTSPPPQMSIADAPSREACTVRRERTNTPLLALMLMNDPQYIDAARALAALVMSESADSDEQRMQALFMRVLLREPSADEQSMLVNDLIWHRTVFAAEPDRAARLLRVGPEPPAELPHDPVELASWLMVCNTLMNLDEFVSKN